MFFTYRVAGTEDPAANKPHAVPLPKEPRLLRKRESASQEPQRGRGGGEYQGDVTERKQLSARALGFWSGKDPDVCLLAQPPPFFFKCRGHWSLWRRKVVNSLSKVTP